MHTTAQGGEQGGEGGANYLSNPNVLIGVALLLYWFFKRRAILKENPNASASYSFLEAQSKIKVDAVAKKHGIPKKLVKDVQQMNKKELATMILDNQKMLNKTKMSQDERKHILKMVDYCEYELEKMM